MKNNRVVVITGAAGGVGALLVQRFLENGDTVIATDADKDALTALRSRYSYSPGARLFTAPADVSSEDDVRELVSFTRTHADHVDVLINCAGYFPFIPFDDLSADDFRRIIDINLTGTFLMSHAFLPLMKGRGWGSIVNYGSGSVFEAPKGQAHYVAAKAGVIGLSRSLAREVGEYGITVNVITPGLTLTKAVKDHFPAEILQAQRDGRALHRDEEPQDLVGPTFFLASPDAAFITGQILNVDGGKTMY